MTPFRRASLVAAMLVAIAIAVAACGGSTATPTPTPTPVGEATPTPAPTPTPEAPPGAEATLEVGIPSFDLGALTGVIPGVDSYRTSFSVNGVEQYQSVVVTQPVLSKAITTFGDGVVSTRFVIIGTDVWAAEGVDGTFQPVPAALASSMQLAFDPAPMLSAYANVDLAGGAANIGVEEKNGVQARHLRIDPTTTIGVGAAMPAGSAIDIWFAEAGYLVAWEMSGFSGGENVSIQVTGVNNPANKVEPPPG